MDYTTLQEIRRDPIYKKGVAFIHKLMAVGVKLRHINVNDWHSSTSPGVFVFHKRCCRMSNFDLVNAIRHYERKLL